MTKNTTEPKKTRTQYSQNYKDDALTLAERVGFSKAATSNLRDTGVPTLLLEKQTPAATTWGERGATWLMKTPDSSAIGRASRRAGHRKKGRSVLLAKNQK